MKDGNNGFLLIKNIRKMIGSRISLTDSERATLTTTTDLLKFMSQKYLKPNAQAAVNNILNFIPIRER